MIQTQFNSLFFEVFEILLDHVQLLKFRRCFSFMIDDLLNDFSLLLKR